MKDLTSSVYSFEDLIKGDFLYVDKTEYIWELIRPSKAMYFLSRPRRFGKSLTVSTLEAIFEGKKELFKGLAIYDKPYDWKKHPVIHLDLGDRKNETPEALEKSLQVKLHVCADKHGICLETDNAQEQFSELIGKLSDKEKVVILIDEYDKPLLDNIGKDGVEAIKEKLSNFYSVIKTTEPYQRFVFMTGVSKFTQVSIFSKLNNLTDITMTAQYATMLGYTQDEFERYFADHLEQVQKRQKCQRPELLKKIRSWYNGYRFEEDSLTVYNPVSIALFFENKGKFKGYWFKTGTPTFLLEMMKKSNFDYPKSLEEPVTESFFDSFELSSIKPKVLLYQTGYLTIDRKEEMPVPYTDQTKTVYYLGFPNQEVESAFNEQLLEYYTAVQSEASFTFISELIEAVGSGDADGFMRRLEVMFANIPFNIRVKQEKYFQTIFFVICDMLRFYVQAEIVTNTGRIDMVVGAGKWVYVIEFKLNQTAEKALQQIHNKDYAKKYQRDGNRIMLIGANFNYDKGEIIDWQKEELTY